VLRRLSCRAQRESLRDVRRTAFYVDNILKGAKPADLYSNRQFLTSRSIPRLRRRSVSDRSLFRAHPQGRQARRPAGGASEQVRAGHQCSDREGAGDQNLRQPALARRRGDRVVWLLPTRVCCICSRQLLALSGGSQGGEFTSAFGGVAEVHGRTTSAAFDANAE
jgi:hypothetical protein